MIPALTPIKMSLHRFTAFLAMLWTPAAYCATIDFEDLPASATYSNATPGSFTSGGVTFDLLRLKLNPTLDSPAGSVSVAAEAGLGAGQGVDIRSVLLGIQVAAPDGLSFLFADGELRKNVEINGELRIFDGELLALHGQSIGGSTISVVDDIDIPGGHSALGTFSLTGPITAFKIGGQDLVLNDIKVRGSVPEPSTWALLIAITVGGRMRRRVVHWC